MSKWYDKVYHHNYLFFSDACEPWHSIRDGLVISGFVFSILPLSYYIAVLKWVVYHVKHEEQPYGKCEELP